MRPFRFGVVAAQAATGKAWAEKVRRIESFGYATLLVPDGLRYTLSPFAALAAAAAVTRDLRLGTYVLASDLHHPLRIAKETGTLDLLSDGRFELGMGAGRPDAEAEARLLGVPFESGGVRVQRLATAVQQIRSALDGRQVGPGPVQQPRPPLMIAASGNRMLALAAREADIVALGLPPSETVDRASERIHSLREAAGARFSELELNLNMMAVAGQVPRYIQTQMGLTADRLERMGSVASLGGSVDEMCATLEERRARLGITYIAVGDELMDALAPVVARLAGR